MSLDDRLWSLEDHLGSLPSLLDHWDSFDEPMPSALDHCWPPTPGWSWSQPPEPRPPPPLSQPPLPLPPPPLPPPPEELSPGFSQVPMSNTSVPGGLSPPLWEPFQLPGPDLGAFQLLESWGPALPGMILPDPPGLLPPDWGGMALQPPWPPPLPGLDLGLTSCLSWPEPHWPPEGGLMWGGTPGGTMAVGIRGPGP